MDETPPYHLDIAQLRESETSSAQSSGPAGRPWIGIHFDCCGVYTRLYRDGAGTAYEGCCPRCRGRVTLRVGPGGTNARFFVAE